METSTSHEKCRVMVVKLVEASLDDHYSGEGHKERVKGVLALDAFAHLKRDQPHADKINDYVAGIMQRLAKASWEDNRAKVISIIDANVSELLKDLLTEDEATELYAFGTSPTGQKVFRNIDLLKVSILAGRAIMTAKIVSEWSSPEVSNQIDQYIDSLNGEDTDSDDV